MASRALAKSMVMVSGPGWSGDRPFYGVLPGLAVTASPQPRPGLSAGSHRAARAACSWSGPCGPGAQEKLHRRRDVGLGVEARQGVAAHHQPRMDVAPEQGEELRRGARRIVDGKLAGGRAPSSE